MTDWRTRADVGDGELIERPADAPPPVTPMDIDTELLLTSLMMKLQRVVTDPGSGDRDFLKNIRRLRPGELSAKQRENLMRLAWRYRFQLPDGLRPGRDPDNRDEMKVAQ